MDPKPLPPELRELEEQLAHRTRPEPSAEFRARVIGGMSDAQSTTTSTTGRVRWRRVWQSAAAAALVLNLAMSIGNGIRFHQLTAVESGFANAAPWLDSSIPPSEHASNGQYDSIALDALAALKPAPEIGVANTNAIGVEGVHPWATR
jgi:hypothetical protein